MNNSSRQQRRDKLSRTDAPRHGLLTLILEFARTYLPFERVISRQGGNEIFQRCNARPILATERAGGGGKRKERGGREQGAGGSTCDGWFFNFGEISP